MVILITNDDGYDSKGIEVLSQTFSSDENEIYIVAPDGQRSAFSHSISFFKIVNAREVTTFGKSVKKCYAVDGTPADCVKFALNYLKIKPDIILSGINNGENTGHNILYSGTVAAAEEGAMSGYKALALSKLFKEDTDGIGYITCANFVKRNMSKLLDLCSKNLVININVPDVSIENILGVRIAKQGRTVYYDYYEDRGDNKYFLTGEKQDINHNDIDDVTESEKGYIVVTPLSIDRTDYKALDLIAKEVFL
ncbi:MAG: 5'/3'-nucleotidase SurE [Clostridia bacterium]